MSNTISGNKVITQIQTRFSDFDPMQHLNNSCYLSYVEIARINAFVEVLGIDIREVSGLVKNTKINYIKPVTHGTELVVITEIKEIGNKSFTLSFQIANKFDHSKVYAEVEMTQVTFCMKTFKPVPHPKCLLDNIDLLNSGQMDDTTELKVAS